MAPPLRHAGAIHLRGLRRLLPGVATLAALAGMWAGARVLSAAHARPLAVLPGSVKAPGGYVYVVRPGDTLWSIATRLDPSGDPRPLVAQLEAEVHGDDTRARLTYHRAVAAGTATAAATVKVCVAPGAARPTIVSSTREK